MNESKTDAVLPDHLPRLKEGETPTASHYNQLVKKIQATANRLGLPPFALAILEEGEPITAEHANALADALETIDTSANPHLWVKLTASDGRGKYAWRELLDGPPHPWRDGPRFGTLENYPAYEVGRNGSLPVGTIVVATLTGAGDIRFQMGGCN